MELTAAYIEDQVGRALEEDVGDGDVTAALIPVDRAAEASVVAREPAVLCGREWFDCTFRLLDPSIRIEWHLVDGERLEPDRTVCELSGPARALLTGERTALNFLQLLSGTATAARACADAVTGTDTRILDTRKTIPGLRLSQKYAVRCGGAMNHRMGLFDAVLIKENHILAAGSIKHAVATGREAGVPVQVEVENLRELDQAVRSGADRAMLDNFSLDDIRDAVRLASGRIELEVSGNVAPEDLGTIAATGVDYISIGAITKHVRAVDFSMRFGKERKE